MDMVTSVTNVDPQSHTEPADPVSARDAFLAELQLERFGPRPPRPRQSDRPRPMMMAAEADAFTEDFFGRPRS